MRPHKDQDYRALKTAARQLVSQIGGQEAAASFTRVGHQTLSDYGNLQKQGSNIPVDVVADLEDVLGDPVVTRQLARLSGCEMVPTSARLGSSVDAQMIGQLSKEFGDVMSRVGEAIADDGVIDAEEIKSKGLLSELSDLIGQAVLVREELKARVK